MRYRLWIGRKLKLTMLFIYTLGSFLNLRYAFNNDSIVNFFVGAGCFASAIFFIFYTE